jgi:isopentenyldiphosphate isomerase
VEELLDVLDPSGKPTGQVAPKSEAHRLGLWHRCFHCWVLNPSSNDGGPHLLVQRRAAYKDTWPERLDVSAAGHLSSGEEPLDGLRELEEELGLRVSPRRLLPLGTRRVEQEIPPAPGFPGGTDREFHEVYLLLDATPPGKLRLQREEVAAVLRLPLGAAEALHGEKAAIAQQWDGEEYAEVRVRPEEFVPGNDRYLRRVARAARRVLAGEPPESLGRTF